MGAAITVTNADGVIVEANAAACALARVDRQEVVGAPLLALAERRGASDHELAMLAAASVGRDIAPYIADRTLPDGQQVHFRVQITAIRDPAGEPAGLTIVASDAGAQRRAEQERDRMDARGRFLVGASRVLASSLDLERTLTNVVELIVDDHADGCAIALCNPDRTLQLAALRQADPDHERLIRTLFPDRARPPEGGMIADVLRTRTPRLFPAFDPRVLAALDPALVAIVEGIGLRSVLVVPLVARESVLGVLAVATTARSDRRFDAADAELFAEIGARAAQAIDNARLMRATTIAEERFRTAFDHAPIGIALVTLDETGEARYAEVNPALCTITGYDREALIGRAVADLTHPDDRDARTLREGWSEQRHVRADGEVRWVHMRVARIDGGVFVAQIQDVTEQRRFQDQLEHLASHDPLTGLLNRRRFEEELEVTLADVHRHGDAAAVLTLDIDNFKHVNDAYGHAVGDEMLKACARALERRVRITDEVARLGGDEFGVILRRTAPQDARAVARNLLEEIRRVGVELGERTVRVTASAGLRALEGGNGRTAGELLGEADIAMYDAKEQGRDRLSMIEPGDLQPERVRARVRWSERIRDALDTDGFVLFEQPILRLDGDTVDRSELLIRMIGDAGEPIAPGAFLPVAERYGQIRAIDRWVVKNAIQLLADRREARTEMAVEVNLSGDSLTDPAVVDFIMAEIRNATIDPSRLVFEVTETAAISNLDRARRLALQLAELGCGFALDDFGSGFSSFHYLKHLPLDVIKIDGEFIRSLLTSRHDQVTVQAIVDIARGLEKETVAEFVEDASTLEALRKLGVDRAQGYHVGRPRPAAVTPAF